MNLTTSIFFGVVAVLFGGFHLLAVVAIRRELRVTVPGTWPAGTPQQPRHCVTGRPEAGHEQLLSPLTQTPCAAWRLTLEHKTGPLGLARARYHQYSAASFWLAGEGTKTLVVLHPGVEVLVPRRIFTLLVPPWRSPRAGERSAFAVALAYASPTPPTSSRRPAQRAHTAALELMACHELPADILDQEVTLSETIVDFEQQWVCEGPRQLVDGAIAIVSGTSMTGWIVPPNLVKLSPRAEIRAVALRAVGRELLPVLALDAAFGGIWVWVAVERMLGI